MTLDPTFVPGKYQPFMIPAVRRIYLNADPSRTSTTSRQLQEQLTAAKKESEDLTSKLKSKDLDIKLLIARCESSMAAAATHAKGERDVRIENGRLRDEINHLVDRCRALQVKVSDLEHQNGSSGGEVRPDEDPLRDHSQVQPR